MQITSSSFYYLIKIKCRGRVRHEIDPDDPVGTLLFID